MFFISATPLSSSSSLVLLIASALFCVVKTWFVRLMSFIISLKRPQFPANIHLITFGLHQTRLSDSFRVAVVDGWGSRFELESQYVWWLNWDSNRFLVIDTKNLVHANTCVTEKEERFVSFCPSNICFLVTLSVALLCLLWLHSPCYVLILFCRGVFPAGCHNIHLTLGVWMHTCLCLTKARMLNLQRKPHAIKTLKQSPHSACYHVNCVTSSG